MRQISVVIPTYREAENLSVLIPRLHQSLTNSGLNCEIIIVDDNSSDGTEAIVGELSTRYPVRLLVRKTERGLSSAVIAGMRIAEGNVLVCMDADLSHPPEDVPKLYRAMTALSGNVDRQSQSRFVIGSRYVSGGSTESGWGLGRWLNSKVATCLAWPLTSVSDPMAGFFAVFRADFQRVLSTLDPIGYKIGLELLVKTNTKRATEVPIEFKNRLHGESKLSLREQLNYLRHLGRLYRFRFPTLCRFVTFGLVGITGVVVDLLLFLSLLRAGLATWQASAAAIEAAMTSNFVLNRWMTFADRRRGWIRDYLAFCLSCLVGAGVNAGTRIGLITSLPWFSERTWAAAVVGILAGMVFNFSLCERFVFRRRSSEEALAEIEDEESDTPVISERAPTSLLVWFARAFLVCAIVASMVCARNLLSETRRSVNRSQFADVIVADAVQQQSATVRLLAQSNALSRESAVGTPTISTTLPLTTHRGMNFSDVDSEQRLRADARYLASDELEGRGTQTEGIDKAADHIAREYQKAGLNTNATGKGAFHEFPLLTREAQPTVSQVTIQGPDAVLHPIARGRDFSSVLIPKPKQVSGEIAFVGFGISAPDWGYDDFENFDARGKVLVVLRSEPTHPDWKRHYKPGDEPVHALLRTKVRQAAARGASAMILCDPQSGLDPSQESAELLSLDLSVEFPNVGMPVIHVRREALVELLSSVAQFDLAKEEASIHASLTPQSRSLKNVSLSVRVERPKVSRTLKNVIGVLDGTGPHQNETIVIGAHYDHLGYGGWGSLELTGRRQIHNGADDNASGTVLMLEVARQLASLHHQKPFLRRVCFIAFSAEELGLIGSKKYVQEPWFPLENTVAMLNLDMVGRLRNGDLTVYGVGTSPVWTPMMRALAKQHQLNLQLREGGYGPSDHASFYERGVPVLHFFTGFHPEYHRPSDDAGLLNYRGMTTLSHVVSELAFALTEMRQRPSHSAPKLELSELESPLALGAVVGNRLPATKFQLGIQMASSDAGVVVRGTLPDSLAERHGLREGDVIQSIDGQKVSSPAEAIAQIQKHERAEPLVVSLSRNGLNLKINVTE